MTVEIQSLKTVGVDPPCTIVLDEQFIGRWAHNTSSCRAMLRPLGSDGRSVNNPAVVASVVAAFERYEAALLVNDLDALDGFMWRDPRVVRVGIDDRQDGFAAISAFRRSQARQTPPRVLRDTAVVTFDDDTAVITTTFIPTDGSSWGRQSQTWVRMPEGWRIVAAHVSAPMSGSRQALDP